MEKRIQEVKDFFKDLIFEEVPHKYYVKGEQLKHSVSGLIEYFVSPVDFNAIAENIAVRENTTKEEVQKPWREKNEAACLLGHVTHKFGEDYATDKTLKPSSGQEQAIVNFWNDLPPHIVPFIPEVQMYHKKYMFAGTADLPLYNTQTGEIIITDYKTNEDLFKNFRCKRLLPPFDNILDNPLGHYKIQLSFYQILLEQIPGLKVSKRKVIWLLPSGEYKIYDLEDYTSELNHFLETKYK